MPTTMIMLAFFISFPASVFAARLDFWVSTSESSELKLHAYVTDPLGIKAGHLEDGRPTKTKLGEGYGITRIDDDVDGSLGNAQMEISVNPIHIGTYTITFYGLSDTSYLLDTEYDLYVDTGLPRKNEYAGYISSGAVRTYSMVVTDPNQSPVLIKNVAFGTLRQDLAIASRTHQLPPGDASRFQIGDAKFVAQLDKILAGGEKALSEKSGKDEDRENKKEAVEKLREFVKKLEKAFKDEKDDARDEGDKEHAKSKKPFVSESAFKSLKGDAETLIVALGGNSGDDGRPQKRDEK